MIARNSVQATDATQAGDAPRKVAFYMRVSTDRQAKVEEGSLKNQRQLLEAELARRNHQDHWGTLANVYVDEGMSGKNLQRPAMTKLLADVESGVVTAIFFTELSRLSRSLKDFLNLFEFTQRHGCDLVCLKTDIDTTSPYSAMVTKILMVFSEFEREITAERTAINAYERAKRGLANGGRAPLGFIRCPGRKGHLEVHPKYAAVVREIFRVYFKTKSVAKTVQHIRGKNPDDPELVKISRNRIYTILKNKSYLGIREIKKSTPGETEEVPAVWPAIINRKTFDRAAAIMEGNRGRRNQEGHSKYEYVYSGLIRCEKCGELLWGKSAYSRNEKPHYYYAHKGVCKGGGINRIRAGDIHDSVRGWMENIQENQNQFSGLLETGRAQAAKETRAAQKEQAKTRTKKKQIQSETERRVKRVVREKSSVIRRAIEDSLQSLQSELGGIESQEAGLVKRISFLESLNGDPARKVYADYQERVGQFLRTSAGKRRRAARDLVGSLLLGETSLKIGLQSVNQTRAVSTVLASAP